MKNIFRNLVYYFNLVYEFIKKIICYIIYGVMCLYKAIKKIVKLTLMLCFLALIIGLIFFNEQTVAFLANIWSQLKWLIIAIGIILFIIFAITQDKNEVTIKLDEETRNKLLK